MRPSAIAASFRGSGDMVTVVIEEMLTTYTIPKGLLDGASGAFDAAMTDADENGEKYGITCSGCDDETFDCFLHWLCSGKFPPDISPLALVKTLCFGEVWELPKLQNSSMARLLGIVKDDTLEPSVLLAALKRTSLESKLVKALIKASHYDFFSNNPWDHQDDFEELFRYPGFANTWFFSAHLSAAKYDVDESMAQVTLEMSMVPKQYMIGMEDGEDK